MAHVILTQTTYAIQTPHGGTRLQFVTLRPRRHRVQLQDLSGDTFYMPEQDVLALFEAGWTLHAQFRPHGRWHRLDSIRSNA